MPNEDLVGLFTATTIVRTVLRLGRHLVCCPGDGVTI